MLWFLRRCERKMRPGPGRDGRRSRRRNPGVEGGTEPLRLLNTGKIQVSGCVEGPENTENG